MDFILELEQKITHLLDVVTTLKAEKELLAAENSAKEKQIEQLRLSESALSEKTKSLQISLDDQTKQMTEVTDRIVELISKLEAAN